MNFSRGMGGFLLAFGTSCIHSNPSVVDPSCGGNNNPKTGSAKLTNNHKISTPAQISSSGSFDNTNDISQHAPTVETSPSAQVPPESKTKENLDQEKDIWSNRPAKIVHGIVRVEIAPNGSRVFIPCNKERWEPWLLEDESARTFLTIPPHKEPTDSYFSVFTHVKGTAQISKEGNWEGSNGKFYRFRIKFIKVTPTKVGCP